MLYFCRWSGRLQVSLSLSTDVPRGFRGILDRPKRRTRTCIHQPQRTTMCGHVSGYVVLIYQNQLLPQSHSSCCPSHTTYPVFLNPTSDPPRRTHSACGRSLVVSQVFQSPSKQFKLCRLGSDFGLSTRVTFRLSITVKDSLFASRILLLYGFIVINPNRLSLIRKLIRKTHSQRP
jgi:hypothetical protein